MIVPDNEVFRINTMGTYNVIEAAAKLGIRKIIIASSETTYGLVFANEPRDPKYLPLDEEYPVDPMDSYALSKICNERTAQAFAQRSGIDIYALRIGNVIEPHEYANFPGFFADPGGAQAASPGAISTPATWARSCGWRSRRTGWAIRSSMPGRMIAHRNLPTAELLRRFYPNVKVTRELGEYEMPVLQPQGPRDARLQGGAQLAEIREGVGVRRHPV